MFIIVKVVARSSRNAVEKVDDRQYKVHVTSPPVDGRANEKVIELLSEHFSVSKSAVSIVRGRTGRLKQLEITGITV